MNPAIDKDLETFLSKCIDEFHRKRFESLQKIKLDQIIKRKNPYLYKAKNILTAQDLVKLILDAHLSSQEETLFGEVLEKLAIFVCSKTYNGIKSSSEGIDLEFSKDNIRYLVSIKSGPNWGNSSQIKKMLDNFQKAKKILGTNTSSVNIVSVNGCCYGRDNKPNKGLYLKLCGQRFWEFISGNNQLYIEIIQPLGLNAKQKNENFFNVYAQILNQFTVQFVEKFCSEGIINWIKIIEFNSRENQ